MKLLIIAGPYEADRIRRAAVSAGFETVAIEPGESLSGWIAATRPDLIVMAPQIVNADPKVALAKVRATPRGRVPIFFVGDAADEQRFKDLADGFFVRPIASADLVAQVRARVFPSHEGSGPTPRPAAAGFAADPVSGILPAAAGSGPKSLLSALGLRPLVAQQAGRVAGGAPPGRASEPAAAPATPAGRAGAAASPDLLRHLADGIDASLDAEMRAVARGLIDESAAVPSPALAELRDESSQKTREVESDVVVRMMMMHDGSPAARSQPPQAVARATESQRAGQGAPAAYESGSIGSPDIAILLGRIYLERLNGRLTFRRGLVKKIIYFEKGTPILATSNLPDDRMGEMLARQGRLTREQRIRGSRLLESTGRRFGSVLVEIGALKESELAPLVRRHFEEIIYSVFAWPEGGDAPAEEGEWTLGPEHPLEEEPIRLDEPAPALIMEGIRRKYSAPRLLGRLGGGGQVIRWRASVGAATSTVLDDMALSDEERTLARRFDGVRTLDEIRAGARVADEILCGVAWALVALRLAAPTRATDATTDAVAVAPLARPPASSQNGAGSDASASASASPVTGAPLDSPAPDRTREQEIDRARVLSRYALVQEADYFEVLGVAREATAHEVRRAHQTLTRELSPASLDPQIAAELDGELGAIRVVLDEGARVLGDARLRQRYQAHLPLASAHGAE
jgi:hypothetical protein